MGHEYDNEESMAEKIAEEIYSQRLQNTSKSPSAPACYHAGANSRNLRNEESTRDVIDVEDDGNSHEANNEKLTFVQKLMAVMNDSNFADFLFWNEEGDEIRIVDSKAFATRVLPTYFDRSSFGPFVKELLRWGFVRRPTSPSIEDAFAHKYFRRDSPDLTSLMTYKGKVTNRITNAIKSLKNAQAGAQTAKRENVHERDNSKTVMHIYGQNERMMKHGSNQGREAMWQGPERSERRTAPIPRQACNERPLPIQRGTPPAGSGSQRMQPKENSGFNREMNRLPPAQRGPNSPIVPHRNSGSGGMTDQAFAMLIMGAENGRVPPPGAHPSLQSVEALKQASSAKRNAFAEQALRAGVPPEHLNSFLTMNSMNPSSSSLPGMNGTKSGSNPKNHVTGINMLNGTTQGFQNPQATRTQPNAAATPSPALDESQQTNNSHKSGGMSELGADINAAIEKEVARRLDSIMSIAANMEIMKEQAKATAHFRMAAAAALQQEQELGGVSAEALEEYRKLNEMMGRTS